METEEDWSVADLDILLDVAATNLDESMRCHQAGAPPRAALVLPAGTLEAVLLGMMIAHEDELRAAGKWPAPTDPRQQPSRKHLTALADLARRMGWLSEPITDEVTQVLNKARTMAAHPGAYVRGLRQAPDLDLEDRVGYEVVYGIVVRACQELHTALPGSSPAGPTRATT